MTLKFTACTTLLAITLLLFVGTAQAGPITVTDTTPPTVVDTPAPIPGLLALAAAGIGGAAMRRRKNKKK